MWILLNFGSLMCGEKKMLSHSCSDSAVPNHSDTRDRFRGRQFFHRLGGDGSGRDASDGERWGGGTWSFTRSPATHLPLCGPVPNRPRTGISPWPGDWGPLLQFVFYVHYWRQTSCHIEPICISFPGNCLFTLFAYFSDRLLINFILICRSSIYQGH